MQQAIDSAQIHKRAILGQILDHAGQDRALFQVLQSLRLSRLLFLFQDLLARDHNVAALLVQLDDSNFQRLTLHAVQITHRTEVNLRAGQERARSENVYG